MEYDYEKGKLVCLQGKILKYLNSWPCFDPLSIPTFFVLAARRKNKIATCDGKRFQVIVSADQRVRIKLPMGEIDVIRTTRVENLGGVFNNEDAGMVF